MKQDQLILANHANFLTLLSTGSTAVKYLLTSSANAKLRPIEFSLAQATAAAQGGQAFDPWLFEMGICKEFTSWKKCLATLVFRLIYGRHCCSESPPKSLLSSLQQVSFKASKPKSTGIFQVHCHSLCVFRRPRSTMLFQGVPDVRKSNLNY